MARGLPYGGRVLNRWLPDGPGGIVTWRGEVRDEWIDANEHVNSTHYGLVIYDAHVEMTRLIGMDRDYMATRRSKVVATQTIVYERELLRGNQLEIRSWLLAVDRKRMHFFHELMCVNEGYRAATDEQVDLHVDLEARRVAAMDDDMVDHLREFSRRQLADGPPRGVGRVPTMPAHNDMR